MIMTDKTDTDLQKVCEILRQRIQEIEQNKHCDVSYWEEHLLAIDAGEDFETPQPIPATSEVLETELTILSSLIQIFILGTSLYTGHNAILRQCASTLMSVESSGAANPHPHM